MTSYIFSKALMLITKIILCSRWKDQQRPFYGSLKALQSSPMEMEKRFFFLRARLYEPIYMIVIIEASVIAKIYFQRNEQSISGQR